MEETPHLNPRARDFIITDPMGGSKVINNLSKFCRDNGLNRGRMHAVAKGTAKSYKGWGCARASKQR